MTLHPHVFNKYMSVLRFSFAQWPYLPPLTFKVSSASHLRSFLFQTDKIIFVGRVAQSV